MSETSGPTGEMTDEMTDEPTRDLTGELTESTDVEELPDEDPADEDPAGDDTADEPADAEEAVDYDGDGDGDEPEESAGSTSLADRLEQEGDIAADYLEELLDIADLDGDLDMDVEGERAVVSIVGADLSQLVGARGEVLEALQELTRLAVYRETGERSRLMLDISGHRAQIRRDLEELATQTVAQVRDSGEQVALRPMSPFERKVVHDAVAAAGLTSESEGVEPRRYVVVLPA
jgi:spoIIIJ-associated protein